MRAWGGVLALLLWAGCGAKAPPSPPRQSKLGLPIHAFGIANNGLRVALVPDPKASEIQVTMQYRVGAVDEPAGREGIAHLAEHVMFLPVIGREGETLYGKIEATATWFNAFTGLETTSYVSRADPRRLADLLQIEGLRLGLRCKTVTEEAFVRERDVVRNELRERAGGLRTRGALLEALYPGSHPYRRDAIADEEIVGRISREEVCAFIDAHYSPDNAVLIVSGDVTPEALDQALGKLLGRVSKHPTAVHPYVAPFVRRPPTRRTAPVDEALAIVAWPLPDDPATRARVRAVASMMALHINPEIKGTIRTIEYGAARAPVIAFVIEAGQGENAESIGDAVDAAGRAALAMQVWFRAESFEGARVRAVYRLFAHLEDGAERDELLAEHVFAGRDPMQGLRAEIQALSQLTANEARAIVQDHFSFSDATVVTLLPEIAGKPSGAVRTVEAAAPAAADLDPQIHRPGEPRVRADPAAAHAAAKRTTDRNPLAGSRERTLANGLRVILMPLTSVPTIDVRLVFGAGAVDEPARQHGVAHLAAYGLTPRVVDADVYRAFYTVGGLYDVTVDADHTTFAARGLDMHVDVLLSRLERAVRNGGYPEHDSQEVMRRVVEELGSEDPISGIWRAALYGPDHPYTRAEDWRRARFDALDRGALWRFHARHFQPGAATLIVSGGFDPVVAERWIDYLFADWDGKPAAARAADRAKLQPVALAKYDDGARQVAVNIAIPIGGGRAASLVAARMIDATIADVRQELGASYGLHAALAESRLSTYIGIGGFVAAERAQEALALVRARLGRLAAGDDAAASLFVAARGHVMARMSAVASGASALASLAESAVDLGRPIGADLTAAEAARKLTLGQMASTLGAIDLARAAILLHGPRDAVTRAFTALGRTPRVVAR